MEQRPDMFFIFIKYQLGRGYSISSRDFSHSYLSRHSANILQIKRVKFVLCTLLNFQNLYIYVYIRNTIQIISFGVLGIEDFFYLLVISGDVRQVAMVLKFHSDLVNRKFGGRHTPLMIAARSDVFHNTTRVPLSIKMFFNFNPAPTKPKNKRFPVILFKIPAKFSGLKDNKRHTLIFVPHWSNFRLENDVWKINWCKRGFWTAQFEDEFPARGRGSGHFWTLIWKCPHQKYYCFHTGCLCK